MKRTYPIKEGQYHNLLTFLTAEMSYPSYYEELVVYVSGPRYLKLTLSRRGLTWSWADEPNQAFEDKYKRSNHQVRTGLRDLKEKIVFLASTYGNKGHVSVAPVLSFESEQLRLTVALRPKSLIGEIVTVTSNWPKPNQPEAQEIFRNFIKTRIRPYIGEDLLAKTSRLKNAAEEYVHYGISQTPMLSTRIMDFCSTNGIMAPFRGATYRDVLSAKSNHYGAYEQLFFDLTKCPLLERQEHCRLPLPATKRLSIIIPCYNSEMTIETTLASIQSQRLPPDYWNNIEVIIIDDNSKQPVSNVIRQDMFQFPIQLIRLSRNVGVSEARHIGATHAQGDVLLFVDSDLVLSEHYIVDHFIRNLVIKNAVFVSFKENVSRDDPRISMKRIARGAPLPSYKKDLRINKVLMPDAIGSYQITEPMEVSILEDTNFFKQFPGSRIFGTLDLSCMVTGHNFSCSRSFVIESEPFSREFVGWGMEDVYFGLKAVSYGNFIIPVLSSGVYHIDHPVRSGSEEQKKAEKLRNTNLINAFLERRVQ